MSVITTYQLSHLSHMGCSTNSNVLARAEGNQQLAFKRAKIYRTESGDERRLGTNFLVLPSRRSRPELV